MDSYYVCATNLDCPMPMKWIEDTQTAREEAAQQGYNAFSLYSFSHIPGSNEYAPILKGHLWIELWGYNIFDVVSCARDAIKNLCYKFPGFKPEHAAYFLDGQTTCQICIPAGIIGDLHGSENLPRIHRDIVRSMLYKCISSDKIFDLQYYNTMFNMNLYDANNIYFQRDIRSQLPNGRYIAQILHTSFMEGDIGEMVNLTYNPNVDDIYIPSVITTPHLIDLFQKSKSLFENLKSLHEKVESLLMCSFVHRCFDVLQSSDIYHFHVINSKTDLMIFIGMLAKLGEEGRRVIKALVKHIEGFTDEGLCILINKSEQYPISCDEVRKHYSECPNYCGVYCPFDLKSKENLETVKAEERFKLLPNGLYYISKNEDGETLKQISSYISIEGKIRDQHGHGWGRVVAVRDPDGNMHKLRIPMKDLTSTTDVVTPQLCDIGLEIVEQSDKKLVLDYIRRYKKNITYTSTSKIGWQDNWVYILPDAQYGLSSNMTYFYNCPVNIYTTSGTHQDWIENIGKYCRNNPLMQFVCQLALTGCLLRPCHIEGGGYHLFGKSSGGKTTLAQIAGSICGGGSDRSGFVRQWRTSDNALEIIAIFSNDNLLVIDEVSQARAGALYNSLYMLSNERSKERMRPDTTMRKAESWKIACLSTGEVSLEDKVNSDPRYKYMAGQEVRFIDIPVNTDDGNMVFNDLHGFESAGDLADHLKKMVKMYYGAPLRKFLEFINSRENLSYIVTSICKIANNFVNENCPKEAVGQVRRVAKKFGVVAGAGWLGTSMGVLPWSTAEAFDSVNKAFNIWIGARGSVGYTEIENAINNIVEYIESRKFTEFLNIDDQWSTYNNNFNGVVFKDKRNDNCNVYFICSEKFKWLTQGVDRKSLLLELKKRNMLYLTSQGTVCETKYVNKGSINGNIRGIGIIIKK